MASKDQSVVLVDIYSGDTLQRKGIQFRDNPGATAVDQAKEFAAHHKGRGRTCKARVPKRK